MDGRLFAFTAGVGKDNRVPREIPLTRGEVAIIDSGDYEWLSQWKWQYHRDGYAARTQKINGHKVMILMHRLIMSAPDGVMVDHRDRNRLNNQRHNLRFATRSQQMANCNYWRRSMSGYRGVRLVRKTGRWQAVIMVDQHNKSLGCYATKEEAACVYNEAAQRYFGEYAMLNSVPLA